MILRRISCWWNGHEYAVVTPLTRAVWGSRVTDYTVCLRCLTRGGGRVEPLPAPEAGGEDRG